MPYVISNISVHPFSVSTSRDGGAEPGDLVGGEASDVRSGKVPVFHLPGGSEFLQSQFFLEELAFQHRAERVVDGQVEFLDAVRLARGDADRDVAEFAEASAPLARQADRLHAQRARQADGVDAVAGIAGG